MRKRLPALLVTLVALVSLTGCGASTVSASDVEAQIVSQLKADDGTPPDSASCPGDLDAKVGATIECTGKKGDQDFNVEVKVTKVDGSNASFDITVVE